ncbi:unnamed protein product, partial [Ectocarpus sp. 13 AM-2016]
PLILFSALKLRNCGGAEKCRLSNGLVASFPKAYHRFMYASSSSQSDRRAFDKTTQGTGVTSSATYGAERPPLYNDQGGGTVHISSCSVSGSTSRQRIPQSPTALSHTSHCNARDPLKCRTSSGSIKAKTSRE